MEPQAVRLPPSLVDARKMGRPYFAGRYPKHGKVKCPETSWSRGPGSLLGRGHRSPAPSPGQQGRKWTGRLGAMPLGAPPAGIGGTCTCSLTDREVAPGWSPGRWVGRLQGPWSGRIWNGSGHRNRRAVRRGKATQVAPSQGTHPPGSHSDSKVRVSGDQAGLEGLRGGEELSLEPLRWTVGTALTGSLTPPVAGRGGPARTSTRLGGGVGRSAGKGGGDRETGRT